MNKIWFSALVLALVIPAWAAGPVKVQVKGMVCAYCARGLGEVLRKQPQVDHFKVDLAQGELTLWGKAALDEKQIRAWVDRAGLEAGEIRRD